MTSALPVILSVEDDREMQDLYLLLLEGTARVLTAFTVEEGRASFRSHPEIVLIVMDGNVPSDGPTTTDLTTEIRRAGYTGVIIASTNEDALRTQLLAAGCDRAIAKADIPTFVREFLSK